MYHSNDRFKKTDEKIREVTKDILKRKKYEEIHVNEICNMAGINHSTFYEHYQGLDALMIELENEVRQKSSDIFGNFSACSMEMFLSMFGFMKENKNLYLAFFAGHFNSQLPQEHFKNDIVGNKSLAMQMGCSETDMLFRQSFFFGGLLSMVKYWFLSGMDKSPEWMAKTAYALYQKVIG